MNPASRLLIVLITVSVSLSVIPLMANDAEDHWSFQSLTHTALPDVEDEVWLAHPIDRFIAAEHAKQEVAPAEPAEKRTLIRRATYDLTDLPPSPDEADVFLRDKSPQALGRLVDRLLRSLSYGEQWGRHWLYLVSYADTVGKTADFPICEACRAPDRR